MTISEEVREGSDQLISIASKWTKEEQLEYIRSVLRWPACGYLSLTEQQHWIAAHKLLSVMLDAPNPAPTIWVSHKQLPEMLDRNVGHCYIPFRLQEEGLFTIPLYQKDVL